MLRRKRNRKIRSADGFHLLWLNAFFLLRALAGCGGNVSSSSSQSNITVNISPASASALLGNSASFSATVSGSGNSAVNWSVSGIAGGNAQVGTIAASGEYTAPQILPSPASVTITATAQADSSASASATVTITSDIVVGVMPPAATVATGGAQTFTATIASAGKPAQTVTWSVNGIADGNSTVGTIASTGAGSASYLAPASVPSPPSVTVTATSVADVSKSASATVTIECGPVNSISPSSVSVPLGQSQNFTASLCASAGAAIVWDVNGVVGGSAALGTIAITGASAATYVAPSDLPASNPLAIHATARSQSATASVMVTSNVAVSVMPPNATVAVNGRATFSATVTNTPDATVAWSVAGIANGNSAVGQVCVSGSNPCQPPPVPSSVSVEYLAPANVPSANPVALVATSNADPSRSGSAAITITPASGALSVAIFPSYAFVAPSGESPSQLQFSAQITGGSSGNTSVTWSVQSGVAGSGCGGTACGTIDSTGVYTAPSLAPSPNSVAVIATSVANPSQSATASVSISSGPTIEQILPSSVMAGVASSFTLTLNGTGFVAGQGSSASVIFLNGTALSTTCPSVLQCSTTLEPANVSAAGSSTIQIQNPGEPGPLSNPVPFIVVPFTLTQNVISLTAAQPESGANNIVVFEPTTAGVTTAQINVDFAGPITSGGACNFDSSPIEIAPPSTATAVSSICVHGNLLDPSFAYQFTGPATPDISLVTSSLASLFPNLVQLDLTISSATLPGLRSLFISTPNNDQAVASGLLEVQ